MRKRVLQKLHTAFGGSDEERVWWTRGAEMWKDLQNNSSVLRVDDFRGLRIKKEH
ncbi:unnamed protein product [Lathyrus sativus]|nr:unnamed protein product [Lathyrus sativus]